jgi:hypothetical protein
MIDEGERCHYWHHFHKAGSPTDEYPEPMKNCWQKKARC